MPFHEKKRNLCDWQMYLKNCIHNYEWIVTTLSERLLHILTICPKKLDRSLLLVLGSSFFQFDFFEPRQVRRKFGSLEVPGGREKLVRDKESEFETWDLKYLCSLLLKYKSFLGAVCIFQRKILQCHGRINDISLNYGRIFNWTLMAVVLWLLLRCLYFIHVYSLVGAGLECLSIQSSTSNPMLAGLGYFIGILGLPVWSYGFCSSCFEATSPPELI